MALQACGPLYIPHPYFAGNAAAAFASVSLLDNSADRVALIFRAPFTDSIDQIAVCFATIPTSANLDYRVETVDTAVNANPTGTLWNTNTAATGITPSANVVVAGTLTANASITRGDRVAIVIQETGGGGAIGVNINRVNPDAVSAGGWVGPAGDFPYGSFNLSGSYTNSAAMPVIGVHLATANAWVYLSGALPLVQSFQTTAFNTGTGATTGTRRGLYWTPPFAATLSGMWIKAAMPNSADFNVVLYDSGGTSLATLLTGFDASQQRAQSSVGTWEIPFDTTYDVAAGTVYRVAIVPTTVNSVTLSELVLNAAGHMATLPAGTAMYLTKFVSSAWVEVTTERPLMGLILSKLDDGAGGGSSGGGPLIGGRLVQ